VSEKEMNQQEGINKELTQQEIQQQKERKIDRIFS